MNRVQNPESTSLIGLIKIFRLLLTSPDHPSPHYSLYFMCLLALELNFHTVEKTHNSELWPFLFHKNNPPNIHICINLAIFITESYLSHDFVPKL